MKYVLLILGLIVGLIVGMAIGGNDNGEKREDAKAKNQIQKYVYMDNIGRLHKNNICVNLIEKEYSVKFLNIDSIADTILNNVCPICFTDDFYDSLRHPKMDESKSPSGYDYSSMK